MFRRATFLAAVAVAVLAASAGAAEVPRHLLDYTPNDPFLGEQWNLGPEGVNAYPETLPPGTTFHVIKVAVIDGGVDTTNPDLAGRVLQHKSFVPREDPVNTYHGTMVAGIFGVTTGNGIGLAGIARHVRILDLHVVRASGDIYPSEEAAAIRYAADHGARVINLSLGAPRNPALNGLPEDGYSAAEAEAIRYAVGRGVLVVAAAGNDGWRYADWPAALPHVLSVPAVDQTRTAADFSNRDRSLNDVAAPGVSIPSLVPVSVVASGLTRDAPNGAGGMIDGGGTISGTSFAAPHVAAAAAAILSIRPDLQPSQVMMILEQTARDVGPTGFDAATGFGELDVGAALARALHGPLPPRDVSEPNDDTGSQARWPRHNRFTATLSGDDPVDVYRVRLRAGERLRVNMRPPVRGASFSLGLYPASARSLSAHPRSLASGSRRLAFAAPSGGIWNVVVRRLSGSGAYTLALHHG